MVRRTAVLLLGLPLACGDQPATIGDAGSGGAAADAAAGDADASPVGVQSYPTPTGCTMPAHPVPCGWGLDEDLDGELDRREEYSFDDQGRLTTIEHYSEDDLQQTDVYIYQDNVLVEHEVRNWDDVVGYRVTFEYGNGWVVEHAVDKDDDGSVETRHLYERDEAGNLLVWTVERAEGNDTKFIFSYLEGQLQKLEVDDEPYGSINTFDTYTYFEDGRVRRVEQDQDGNYVYAYDDHGRNVFRSEDNATMSSWFEDECTPSYTIVGPDSQGPYRIDWTYDSNGDLLGAAYDADMDGEPEVNTEVDYSCSPPSPPEGLNVPRRLGGSMPLLSEFPEIWVYATPVWDRLQPRLGLFYEPVTPAF